MQYNNYSNTFDLLTRFIRCLEYNTANVILSHMFNVFESTSEQIFIIIIINI